MRSSRIGSLALAFPWIATFLVFWLFPLIYSLVLGFTDYQLLARGFDWVGWDNYRALLSDPAFISSLKNTLIFVAGTIPATTVIALILALLVNRQFAGRALFRSAFFLPSVTAMVVIAMIFFKLYESGGYIALLADLVGIETPEFGFLNSRSTALYAIMAMDVWMSVGYYMLIFLAGLKSIPEELYEAAEIAGASSWRKFISITLPLLRPVALFVVVINTIKSFQVFVEIFVMTQGGADTSTAVYFVYETGLTTGFEAGYASAAAYLLFLMIGLFSIFQFLLLKQRTRVW